MMMATIPLAMATLTLQAQAVQQRLAAYADPVAAPWRHLVETIVQCACLAPQMTDWHAHLTMIVDLIDAGAPDPSPVLLAEPRFHAHLAEYVCAMRARIAQFGAELPAGTCAQMERAVATCEMARASYVAGAPFLPYLHAVLALRALDWTSSTAVLLARGHDAREVGR
jgi:hypothetical protein